MPDTAKPVDQPTQPRVSQGKEGYTISYQVDKRDEASINTPFKNFMNFIYIKFSLKFLTKAIFYSKSY